METMDCMQPSEILRKRIIQHLEVLYPDGDLEVLASTILDSFPDPDNTTFNEVSRQGTWDQQDCFLVTYGDSLIEEKKQPLKTLQNFLKKHLLPYFSGVHILPFFPYSSDDGFAVSDYDNVRPDLGEWQDCKAIAEDFRLMADLVINHCSASHSWFESYCRKDQGFEDYFIEVNSDEDISMVARPRNSPLLRTVQTQDGTKHIWCTFGHDQLDLNFKNPKVLLEIIGILANLLKQGVRGIRLDAIAYLWKTEKTRCINLPQTHEVVRLLRTLLDHQSNEIWLLTETNVPSHENLSYFGNGNEAQIIYNFSLPPLILHALLTGNCRCLKTWMMSLPPAQKGTAYFNFLASHDGIGLRPVEGILDGTEVRCLLDQMERMGGKISWRTSEKGIDTPYEINISLVDALKATYAHGVDSLVVERFLCAHAILLAIEGIPAIYIHSLLGTSNDHERVIQTGHNRAINRHQWNLEELENNLEERTTIQSKIFRGLLHLIGLRRRQPAFHPNATQFTLHLGDQVFGFWRQSERRDQSIFCLNNLGCEPVSISLADINLITIESWYDLIDNTPLEDVRGMIELAPYQVVWLSNLKY
jgi:sucrose phosphorylase